MDKKNDSTCSNCGGTGRNPGSEYLDCAAPGCAAAADRVALNAFALETVNAGGINPEDLYFAIDKRARQQECEKIAARAAASAPKAELPVKTWQERRATSINQDEAMRAEIAELRAVLAPAPADGWISVAERLPPVGEPVFVFSPTTMNDWPGSLNISIDCIDPNDDEHATWQCHNENYEFYCNVGKSEGCSGPDQDAPYTHWMPVPVPPEVVK